MVVLTFLLAKAAYDRYNSSASEEVDVVEESKSNKNNINNNNNNNNKHRKNHHHHHTRQQHPRNINNEQRLLLAPRKQKSSAASHPRPLTRKPSFQREIKSSLSGTTNNSKGGRSSSNNNNNKSLSTTATTSRHGNKKQQQQHSSTTTRSSSKSSTMMTSSSTISNNATFNNNSNAAYTKPTPHGYFMVNSKSKIIMLPPEQATTRSNNTDSGGSLQQQQHQQHHQEHDKLDKLVANTEFPLSSAEMTSAMMGGDDPSDQLPLPKTFKKNQITHRVIDNGNTTFRNDVRNEWVDAVFGRDFFPLQPHSSGSGSNSGGISGGNGVHGSGTTTKGSTAATTNEERRRRMMDISVKQGVGAAGIPHYVTYGAVLDASSSMGGGSSTIEANAQTTTPMNNKTPTTTQKKGHRKIPSLQSKTQSTPLLFSSPSSSSLLGTGGGTLLASASLTSLTPSAVCGELAGVDIYDENNNDGNNKVNGKVNMGFQTPSATIRNDGNFAAKYTVEGATPATTTTANAAPNTPGTNYTHHSNSTTNPQHHHQQHAQPKLGITISRIPLGLYVNSISLDSEAYTVGISPGSILVDVNGMGMLGERSDRALERLWWYAGIFGGNSTNGGGGGNGNHGTNGNGGSGYMSGGDNSVGSDGPENSSNNNNNSGGGNLQMKKPLVLTFYKTKSTTKTTPTTSSSSNNIYTVVLLSGNPLRGINWAPCGNFALVHKVATGSIAAEAGVRRGTLVVGVNSCSGDSYYSEGLRSLDHGGVAGVLKERFTRGETITLSMGYTPAASRSGFVERDNNSSSINSSSHPHHTTSSSNTAPSNQTGLLTTAAADGGGGSSHLSTEGNIVRSNNTINSIRDVEVRSRPVEYSSAMVETFFACTGPSAMAMVDDGTTGIQHSTASSGGGGQMNAQKQQSTSSSSLTAASSVYNNHGHYPTAAGIAEVAAYVGAGGILPPGGVLAAAAAASTSNTNMSNNITAVRNNNSSNRRLLADGRDKIGGASSSFAPCPTISPDRLLNSWNSLGSLARSMAYAACGCCETSYLENGGPFERLVSTTTTTTTTDGGNNDGVDQDIVGRKCSGGEAPYTPLECIAMIESIANHNNTAPESSPPLVVAIAAEEVFDAHLLQLLGVAISPDMGNVDGGQRLSERLMDIVISVALNDINLCQRLFFVLRSFIGLFEEQKLPPHGYYISEQSASAMRLCRYAQRRLSGRMFDKSAGQGGENKDVRFGSEGYPMNRERSSTSRMQKNQQDYDNLAMSASESPIGNGRMDCEYPLQEPNARSTRSSAEGGDNTAAAEHQLVAESLSEDLPASHGSSRENYDQNSTALENDQNNNTMLKKKSKSQKILRMLKPGKPSMRSFKKPTTSDHVSTATPSVKGNGSTTPSYSKSRFPYPFHRQNSSSASALQTIDTVGPPLPPTEANSRSQAYTSSTTTSLSRKFENMAWILRQIDKSTTSIEKNLMKTFSQKMADWALYPWSESKESALASVTASFRTELRLMNSSLSSPSSSLSEETRFPILNPVDPTELLTSVDVDECFILPSAHFPLLLCFNSEQHVGSPKRAPPPQSKERGSSGDTVYRTRVEILGLRSTLPPKANEAYVVQGTVAGVVQESGVSDVSRRSKNTASYRWTTNNSLVFETKSNWGYPKALSLKVSNLSKYSDDPEEESHHDQSDMGCGFVDLCPIWNQGDQELKSSPCIESKTKLYLFDSTEEFDQHGQAMESARRQEGLELHLRVSSEVVSFGEQPRKRLLLYKHGDDLRQELLAIQFIERCNHILLASGLDLKLMTFSCQPVGSKTGFIEWVRGTVPLSELCKTSGGSSHPGSNVGIDSRQSSRSKEGLTDNETLGFSTPAASEEVLDQQQAESSIPSQSHRWFKYEYLPGLRQKSNGYTVENPIQDFLRSAAFDEDAPYFVKKDVMATYVKSCAGYCVITYLLGVGDRHLDNILLHQNGHLLHCDYSFILGQDPKTYLPMRITEEMIKGLGGRDSDNFAKFLFFTGAAFLTLRRHNNLHSLLSHIYNMIHANMADVSINQPPEDAILAMRGRFRLDLNDDDALAYIEDVVEKSITSKMWRAVDVMHSLGKHF